MFRSYPWGHAMRGWTAEVDVEHPDGDQDGEGDQDHREQKVLACNREKVLIGCKNMRLIISYLTIHV